MDRTTMKQLTLAAFAAALVSVMAMPLPAIAAGPAGYGPARIDVAEWVPRYRIYRPNRSYVTFGFSVDNKVGRVMPRSYDDDYDDDHVARCEAHYRSYDASSDTYLGYDGDYHRCRL
jgi:hypothetical protein